MNYYKSPFGELVLGSYAQKLCLCDWRYRKVRTVIDNRIFKALNTEYKVGTSVVIDESIGQLNEYFAGERHSFDIPLLLIGSDFQKQVWTTLLEIPYGQTKSYLELSKQLNNEGAIRAVASANGANAISIIVPCHRVIGTDGSLTGYAGGLKAKEGLLKHEGVSLDKGQLSLF